MYLTICLTYLPLACRNRPPQRTQTGPLPFDPKDKGPREPPGSEATTGQHAARPSGCWAAGDLCGVNVYAQLQARTTNLILQRQPNELSFTLPKRLSKPRSSLRTH